MQARGILKKRSQSFDVCVLELSITSKYLNWNNESPKLSLTNYEDGFDLKYNRKLLNDIYAKGAEFMN
jgi:hypothetical protein